MNLKGIYNTKLRAAKRRIFYWLEADGVKVYGVKQKHLISEFLNRNDIQRPIGVRWQDFIISLYESKELPEGTLKPRKRKATIQKEKSTRRQDYIDYLNSPEWRAFRKSALEHFGNRCGLCDAEGTMDLHHKTYKNFKKETFADVIPLCRPCHKRHHKR